MVKRVSDKFFIAVAPRRGQKDVAEAGKGGISLIINNRPDGESEDQMSSAEIEAEARAAGVNYIHVPVVPETITDEQIAAMEDAIKQGGDGYILATCRTGNRAMIMYALVQAKNGVKFGDMMDLSKEIGFDLIEHRDRMMRLNGAYEEAQKAKAKAEG